MNGPGSLAGELLEYDRTGDGIEVRSITVRRAPIGPNLVDHLTKNRIDFPQMRDCFATN